MSTGTWHQFIAVFKKKVIEYAEVNRNMPALRQFGISEKSIRYWRTQKGRLSTCNAWKMFFCGDRAVRPELEDKVANFVHKHRARSFPVTAELTRIKAIELTHEYELSREQFKGSIYWAHRFMRREGFALRRERPTPSSLLFGDC